MNENKKYIFIILAGFYLISMYAANSFYDSDIKKYQDALSGKKFLFPPTELEEKKWDLELSRLQYIEAKSKYEFEKATFEKRRDADLLEFMHKKAEEKIDSHYENMNRGHNPPKQRLEFLIKDASSKNTSLFLWTMFAGGSLLGILVGVWGFKRKE